MAKKASTQTGQKRYIAKVRIASRDGFEVWSPGAEIWLDDETATKHLAKGRVIPADETQAPPEPEPVTVIHEAKENVTDGTANSPATDK